MIAHNFTKITKIWDHKNLELHVYSNWQLFSFWDIILLAIPNDMKTIYILKIVRRNLVLKVDLSFVAVNAFWELVMSFHSLCKGYMPLQPLWGMLCSMTSLIPSFLQRLVSLPFSLQTRVYKDVYSLAWDLGNHLVCFLWCLSALHMPLPSVQRTWSIRY